MRHAVCILVAVASLWIGTAALACSCTEPRTPLQELGFATAVFSGRVTNVESVDRPGRGLFSRRVTIARADCWKGAPDNTIVVWTADSDAACGIGFAIDTEWLVYAFGPSDDLSSHLCSRTWYLASAAYDLAQLGTPTCTVPVTPTSWSIVKHLYDR